MQMNYKIINKESFKDIFFIVLGSSITSIGINLFLSHAKLLSGGVTGIALTIQYLSGFQAGAVILLLNIPLFILSYFKLEKKFTLYSLIGTVSLSIFLIITHPVSSILNLDDKLLLCLYGGAMNGLGFGIVFTHNGSTGGFDIIAMLLKRKYGHIQLGNISLSLNLIIVGVGAAFLGLSNGLYTLASMFVSSTIVDKVVNGLKRNKLVFVITDREEEIKTAVMKNLHRGVTFLYGEGAYTCKERKVLYTIIHINQMPEMKLMVKEIDPQAFMTIVDASEVEGKGFKNAL